MADFAQLDEDLDALADGVDLHAVLEGVQSGLALSDVDAQLGALAEGVAMPEATGHEATDEANHKASRSFAPPKMSEEEQLEAEAEHAASGAADPSWGNLSAALTPSDLAELAALEAGIPYVSQRPEAGASVQPESVRPASVRPASGRPASALPSSIPPASIPPAPIPPIPPASIPPEFGAPSASVAPARLASIPPPTPDSQRHPFASAAKGPSEPSPENTNVFSEEDIAAIRASTPPPAGDFGSVEVEIGEIEEIALDDLELIEFEDLEGLSELEAADPSDSPAADGSDAEGGDAEGSDSDSEGDGEKKGFFKKIFG